MKTLVRFWEPVGLIYRIDLEFKDNNKTKVKDKTFSQYCLGDVKIIREVFRGSYVTIKSRRAAPARPGMGVSEIQL